MPGLALRVYLALSKEALWYDEVFSILVARLPLPQLLAATAGDVHPPLYYLLLKAWLWCWAALPVEAAARSFSLYLSLITLILFGMALQRLGLSLKQMAVAGILAVYFPSLIYFAAEARMYALLEFEVLAGLLALTSKRWWVRIFGGGLALGSLAWTHNVGLFYAATLAGMTLILRWKQPRVIGELATAGTLAAVAWLPWAVVLLNQIKVAQAGYWTWLPDAGTLAYMTFRAVFYPTWLPDIDPLCLVMMPILAWALMPALYQADRKAPALLLGTLGLALLLVAVSWVTGVGILMHRSLVPAAFFLAAALSLLWERIEQRLVLAALFLGCLGMDAGYLNGKQINDSRVLTLISEREQAGDILYSSTSAMLPALLYVDLPVVFMPPDRGIREGLSLQTMQALGLTLARPEQLPTGRIWVIDTELPQSTPDERRTMERFLRECPGTLIDYETSDGDVARSALWLIEPCPTLSPR